MSDWILKVTGAQMPASCRSRYSVVRVLEVDAGVLDVPSVRSKSVHRVVYESNPVPAAGATERSGLQRALAKANDMIARRAAIEENARVAAEAAARRRAELAQREHEAANISRQSMQDIIVEKLARGERLTEIEYASL